MRVIVSYLAQMALPALFGGVVWLLFWPWRRRRLAARGQIAGPYREMVLLFFFLFVAGLLGLTLTPAGFWEAILDGKRPQIPPAFQGGINLTPFRESLALFRYYVRHRLWEAVVVNFPGNILMFLPVGFFPALLSNRPRWWKGTFFAAFLSFWIEFCQMFVSRGTDIDDLILNTIGGLTGHWTFLVFRRAAPETVQKCAKKELE